MLFVGLENFTLEGLLNSVLDKVLGLSILRDLALSKFFVSEYHVYVILDLKLITSSELQASRASALPSGVAAKPSVQSKALGCFFQGCED